MATQTIGPTAGAVWAGSQALQLTKKGEWKGSPEGVTCDLEYKGPYLTVLGSVPLIGDIITGYTAFGMKVFSWNVASEPGGIGRLDVHLSTYYTTQIIKNPNFGALGDPIPQLLWHPYKVRIEAHPKCGTYMPAGSGDVSSYKIGDHIPLANYNPKDGGWAYSEYESLIQAGITDYDEKQPLLTLTTHSYNQPANLGINNFCIDVPDATLLPVPPGDWQWLRGGDDLARQDKMWKLTQSWTGFTSAETQFALLYATAIG